MFAWLQRFMMGRYARFDQLSIALLVAGMAFSLLSSLLRFLFPVSIVLLLASYVVFILLILRFLSRNYERRLRENDWFIHFWSNLRAWYGRTRTHWQERRTYRFFKCPTCKQKLRVPKGKGKISISCPRCRTSFVKKT